MQDHGYQKMIFFQQTVQDLSFFMTCWIYKSIGLKICITASGQQI